MGGYRVALLGIPLRSSVCVYLWRSFSSISKETLHANVHPAMLEIHFYVIWAVGARDGDRAQTFNHSVGFHSTFFSPSFWLYFYRVGVLDKLHYHEILSSRLNWKKETIDQLSISILDRAVTEAAVTKWCTLLLNWVRQVALSSLEKIPSTFIGYWSLSSWKCTVWLLR